ncbi:flavohemoglobin expression-modulating QEGLA motif protein [Novilysobacter erysipheiresistens]|uniref:Flavohemoglobin expression-modulating QEGLA motif protein n=1 Tax=Novilysobacter erysipheiresistens TaxID=1749332 RepID=A0ABU7Z009_9GAMM
MPDLAADIAHHAALDARMVEAAGEIRLLSMASWPAGRETDFCADYARGVARLPQIEYPRHDFSDTRNELDAIARAADPEHPLGQYLIDSARSWGVAAQLCECLGTAAVTDLSIQLYGSPFDPLPGDGPDARVAARHFLAIADEYDRELISPAEHVTISATALQLQLQRDLDDYFNDRVIEVVLDPDLIAKAAAGATRIRLRTTAAFSDYDRAQLLQHEAFVHSLSALNGRRQPVLASLALSSPRATATQEGLATFAEQITGSIDISRMKRLSLRIEAVAMALEGADFIEVFRYFLDSGQSPEESFASAQRVFRGVPTTGGAAFTKDAVYLRGLVGVHTFFRWALRQRQLRLCRWLFAGKMTLLDVQRFVPLFESGVLLPPRWLPQWIARANGLAGMLAFSLFANQIRLDAIEDSGFQDI